MQLIATSNTEYFGNTVPRSLELVHQGKVEEAMALYWQISPARAANTSVVTTRGGGTNFVHRFAWKYQAWLNGYSGGPLRMPTSRLLWNQMEAYRRALVASGLDVTDDPDEAFFVGRFPS
jgi:4-hydroxy-tetrahydrodipicolinate synthase